MILNLPFTSGDFFPVLRYGALQDLIITRGWTEDMEAGEKDTVSRFVNHGMTRAEAEDYCRKQREIREHLMRHRENASIVTTGGLMISYGWK